MLQVQGRDMKGLGPEDRMAHEEDEEEDVRQHDGTQ